MKRSYILEPVCQVRHIPVDIHTYLICCRYDESHISLLFAVCQVGSPTKQVACDRAAADHTTRQSAASLLIDVAGAFESMMRVDMQRPNGREVVHCLCYLAG
jgi:hypothetical protein